MIGRYKYDSLKRIPIDQRTEEEKSLIEIYENAHCFSSNLTEEQIKINKEYFKSIREPNVYEPEQFQITYSKLKKIFLVAFEKEYQKEFIFDENTEFNLATVLMYFSKNERFFKSPILSDLSKPSFDKGLLIMSGYGTGKTSIMSLISKIFVGIKAYTYTTINANEVVEQYENCSNSYEKEQFWNLANKGVRYFDDVKTERSASNFGKVNLMREIIEKRYIDKKKTHITCNYKEGFDGDLEKGLFEFAELYGGRVYDRLFEMFNIVEFKGKSLRI